MADRLEYGCRWTNADGETSVVKGHSADPLDVLEVVESLREVQRHGGRIPDAHLIGRHLDEAGLPIDDWHAIRPSETTNA
ncbi:hypothetical protein IU501_34535 [Nocardia otitidiscaviarum]|uniref:hypothetical protein n=1 Tax=Nocardia otitidiscaviarum TaxID=1823 RepID=UPI001895FEE7|nr:hypothetical protein [Nocardia otitidiscaviarum]MBF6138088.1 hypothetical protein [Nocardia otitidiscaviarum]